MKFGTRFEQFLYFLCIVLCILLAVTMLSPASAQDDYPPIPGFTPFVTCVEPQSESGSPRYWFGYSAEADVLETTSGYVPMPDNSAVGILGLPLLDYPAGTVKYLWGVELVTPESAVFWETYRVTADGEFQYVSISVDLSTDAPICPNASDASAPNPMPPDEPPAANYGVGRNITAYVSGTPGVSRCAWAWTDGVSLSPIAGTTGIELTSDGQTYCNLPLSADNPDTNPAHYVASVE